MTEKTIFHEESLVKQMFNSGNVNLTPKFHGENFKMDGLLNRLGMEALKGH